MLSKKVFGIETNLSSTGTDRNWARTERTETKNDELGELDQILLIGCNKLRFHIDFSVIKSKLAYTSLKMLNRLCKGYT